MGRGFHTTETNTGRGPAEGFGGEDPEFQSLSEIEETAAGFTRLTVIHELENAPGMATMVSNKFSEMGTGGWTWILSDLKSLLETGSRMV